MGIAVVDASALITILTGEPEAGTFSDYAASHQLYLSPINYVEVCNVTRSRNKLSEFEGLMAQLSVIIHPTDAAQARLARDAYARFGKGLHPASLNLGDCFAYALALSLRAPLLYKGVDFAKTDVMQAIPQS